MLEAVVVVGVLLALAVGGFFSYGPIVKNAKIAKVKSVVSEVYTAVTVAHIDGDPATTATSVIGTYNASQDKIKLEIREGVVQPVVAAMTTADYEPKSDNDFCVKASMINDASIFAEQGACSELVAPPTPGPTPTPTPEPTVTPTAEPTPTPPPGPYVDPTPTLSKLTYKCDTTNGYGFIPMSYPKGKETWSDGVVINSYGGQTSATRKTLIAGTEYTVVFEGTYTKMQNADLNRCLRRVDHLGSNSGMNSLENAFLNAYNLTSVPSNIPSTVTNMQNAFKGATSFNSPNISNWDVSNSFNTRGMFEGATSFNQPLNNWNVAKVTTMQSMFRNAPVFNQPLNNWDIGDVVETAFMFNGANAFNQDLSSWDTSKLRTMAYMFDLPDTMKFNIKQNTLNVTTTLTYRCDTTNGNGFIPMNYAAGVETWSDGTVYYDYSHNQTATTRKLLTAGITYTVVFEGTYTKIGQPDLNRCLRSVERWAPNSGVTSTMNAFSGAINLTNVPDSLPSTVTNMQGMFNGATNFNDPDVKNWNVGNVFNMASMFNGASNFNQNLSGWDVNKVTTRTNFDTGSALTSGNLPLFK
jgi:surface protein